MEKLFNSFSSDLTISIILFVILIVVIVYSFAKERTGKFFIGFLRVLGSFIQSPIVFLKRSIFHLANYGEEGENLFDADNQYLLLKLHTVLKLMLIIVGVAIISSGIITSCNALLPPEYLTNQIDELETQIDQIEEEKGHLEDKKEELDDWWNDNKEELIPNYKTDLNNNISTFSSEYNKLKEELSQNPELSFQLQRIANFVDNYPETIHDVNRLVKRMNDFIRYQYIPNSDKDEFYSMINLWKKWKSSQLELKQFDENDFRMQQQPDLANINYNLQMSSSRYENLNSGLENLEDQAEYNFSAFFTVLIVAFITFLLVIWIIGIILESLLLGIDLASNVAKINKKIDKKEIKNA